MVGSSITTPRARVLSKQICVTFERFTQRSRHRRIFFRVENVQNNSPPHSPIARPLFFRLFILEPLAPQYLALLLANRSQKCQRQRRRGQTRARVEEMAVVEAVEAEAVVEAATSSSAVVVDSR